VADSLYWMSRYLERSEHTARMLLVNLTMMLDEAPHQASARWELLTDSLYIKPPANTAIESAAMIKLIVADPATPNAIFNCIIAARENARNIREQISSEMWEHLNELYLMARETLQKPTWQDSLYTFLRAIRDSGTFFQGVTDSTFAHSEGWQFIQAGRYLERANSLSSLLDVYAPLLRPQSQPLTSERYLELVGILKSCTAFEAYCKVYTADLHPEKIIEFLLLNPNFPHSIRFSIERLEAAIDAIAVFTDRRKGLRVNRLVGKLQAALSYDQIDEIMAGSLHQYLKEIDQQCAEIHTAIHETYIAYSIDSALAS
jgi:uncharacterized alpha-E superfamily protein